MRVQPNCLLPLVAVHMMLASPKHICISVCNVGHVGTWNESRHALNMMQCDSMQSCEQYMSVARQLPCDINTTNCCGVCMVPIAAFSHVQVNTGALLVRRASRFNSGGH